MNMQPRPHPSTAFPAPPARSGPEGWRFLQDCRQRARVIERGREVVGEGEDAPGAIWVLSGRVGLRKALDDGRSMMVDLLLPIDVVHPATADLCSSCFEATASETCVVAVFSQEETERLHRDCSGFAPVVDLLSGAGRARRSERMLRVVRGRAEERVAFLLLELALRTAREDALARRPCTVRLSQREAGEMTGLSSVHVCRVTNRLAERGLLRSRRGRMELLDVDALAELARADPDRLARAILV